MDNSTEDPWGYVGEEIEIGRNCKHYKLIPKDNFVGIEDSPGEDYEWDEVKSKIKMMRFTNPSGTIYTQTIYIDNIKI